MLHFIALRLKGICLIALFICVTTVKAQQNERARSTIYQYAVKAGARQAYLWVPPKCRQVKGLIISFANLLERNWLEDPIIRKTATKNNLGIILVEPSADGLTPDLTPEGKIAFLRMLKELADESGYPEIADAPFIPIDHSVHGVFTWNLPNWLPSRTIAAIPVKTFPLPFNVGFSGVPICYIIGETDEWPPVKDGRPWRRDYIWPLIRTSAVSLRNNNQNNLVSVVTDPGGGHLDWSAKLSTFMALFIEKACRYRLPSYTAPGKLPLLKDLQPPSGWLTDTAGLHPDTHHPSPYLQYQGDRKSAYWFFDKEIARAAVVFNGDRKPRKKQMLTFIQNGKQASISKQGFISLAYLPEPNGTTFRLQGDFLPAIPPEFIGAGTPLGHADGPIEFRVITGPAVQVRPGEFEIALNRSSPGGDVWIQAEHPGNSVYSHAVQPAQIKLPAKLTEGLPQTITFPEIANQPPSKKKVKLQATSNRNLPVNYFVVSGPAIVKNNLLQFTDIPVKSRYPIKVTVTAYQWGSLAAPLYQSAAPVTKSFFITK